MAPTQATDQQLMAALCRGDPDALESLVQRHRSSAQRYAYALVQDDFAAEEIVQDAFARVYLLRDSYQPAFAFHVWLRVILRSLCMDHLRRSRRQPLPLEELSPSEVADSPEALVVLRETRRRLWQEVTALRKEDQQLLIGFALEGKSYKELASALHLSLPQVRIRLHRIRKALRQKEDAAE